MTLNLEKGTFSAYRKPNDHPIYIHKDSNHPPNVIKEMPKSINKRLSAISSTKEEFDLFKPDYQKALDDGGHTTTLNFEDPTQQQQKPKKRNRSRNIIWFNPPWNAAVTTNIGACFLKLVDKNFKKDNPLHKILNRNTIKVSYSCTKNIKAIIASHNSKILNGPPKQREGKKCNCLRSRKDKCPMRGDCCHSDVIYHATVKEEGEEDRKYVGSAKNFKKRYYGHAASFRDSDKKHNTALSTHVWERELNPEPEIEWSILAHAPAYSKGNRNCDLCLTEKLHIARNFSDPAYLNRRSELAQRCRHKPTFLLQPPAKKGNGDEG